MKLAALQIFAFGFRAFLVARAWDGDEDGDEDGAVEEMNAVGSSVITHWFAEVNTGSQHIDTFVRRAPMLASLGNVGI